MTVKLENGSRVYGTQPASLEAAERGDKIEFTATFEAAEREPAEDFAFFKRPTRGRVL